MADFIGDFVSAASDLAHELRCAAGTVLTILGSRLEADARARVECGPQWLTEFEEQRDSLEPGVFPTRDENAIALLKVDPDAYFRITGLHLPNHLQAKAIAGALDVINMCVCGHPQTVHYRAAGLIDPCSKCDCLDLLFPEDPAATPHAADPSPAVRSPSPASVGDEGPGGASDIPQSAPPGQPHCQCGDPATCMYPDPVHPVPPVVAGESPREESTDQPSLGEPVSHEDLAAHLTGAAIRANTGHPDVLIDAFASSLLADFNITKK